MSTGAEPSDEHDGTVEALLATTRVLVGVAAHAMEQLGALDSRVTLSQFRLLYTLAQQGPTSGARAAEELGLAGSTVTRLADVLEDAGHLSRRRERPNRSVVILDVTESGRALVQQIVAWRRAELARIAAELDGQHRRELTTSLRALCAAADHYATTSDLLPW